MYLTCSYEKMGCPKLTYNNYPTLRVLNGSDEYRFSNEEVLENTFLGAYRYGYQGQFAEADPETQLNSFELRMYDPAIGRWLSVDPKRQYPSGYVGQGNNPVSGVDPDGGCNPPCPNNEIVSNESSIKGTNVEVVGPIDNVLNDKLVEIKNYVNKTILKEGGNFTVEPSMEIKIIASIGAQAGVKDEGGNIGIESIFNLFSIDLSTLNVTKSIDSPLKISTNSVFFGNDTKVNFLSVGAEVFGFGGDMKNSFTANLTSDGGGGSYLNTELSSNIFLAQVKSQIYGGVVNYKNGSEVMPAIEYNLKAAYVAGIEAQVTITFKIIH